MALRSLAATVIAVALLAGCELVAPSTGGGRAILVVNRSIADVDVLWTGPTSGRLVVEPCENVPIPVTAGDYVIQLSTAAGVARQPVTVPAAPTVTAAIIGVSPDGSVSLGHPRDDGHCRFD